MLKNETGIHFRNEKEFKEFLEQKRIVKKEDLNVLEAKEQKNEIKIKLKKLGKKHSEETKDKMKKSHIGISLSEEHKKNIGLALKGKKRLFAEETKMREKLRLQKLRLGKYHSEETKKRMSESHKRERAFWFNKKLPEEIKRKISKTLKDKVLKGEKSPLWKGGISFEPYGLEWTKTLRKAIRERDNYVCQLCNKIQTDNVFSVHHIDYDKKNCNPNNLITLCDNCHTKTNIKNREYWKEYFDILMFLKIEF